MTPAPDLSLDCRGMKCPQPIIVLAQRISGVPLGTLVELRADDPAAEPDVAAWCRMRRQQLVSSNPPLFLVRRVI